MIELYGIRNEKQREIFIEGAKRKKLPFRGLIQDIQPHRNVDMNAYLWGPVYDEILKGTGYISKQELHDEFCKLFNVYYWPEFDAKQRKVFFDLKIHGTSSLDMVRFMEFVFKVRTTGMFDVGVNIPALGDVMCNDDEQTEVLKFD